MATADISAQKIQSILCSSVNAEYMMAAMPLVVRKNPISMLRRNFFSCLLLMEAVLVHTRGKNNWKISIC